MPNENPNSPLAGGQAQPGGQPQPGVQPQQGVQPMPAPAQPFIQQQQPTPVMPQQVQQQQAPQFQPQPQIQQQPVQQTQPQFVQPQQSQQGYTPQMRPQIPVQQMPQPQPVQQYQGQQQMRPQMNGQQMQQYPGQQQVRPQIPGQPMQQGQIPGQPLQPGQRPLQTRKPPNPKNLVFGCLGCFGIAILLFIVLVLVFVAQTTPTGDNPLAKSLGMDAGSFVNTLITVVGLVFGGASVLLFLLAIIGVFRFFMARKDDKDARSKGLSMAGVSALLLFLVLGIWIALYAFMSSRKVAVINKTQIVGGITTEPAETLGLTAPVEIKFDASNAPIPKAKYDILSYNWDFGDGDSSTIVNPVHTYKDKGKSNGRYDITVEITVRDKTTKEEISDKYTTTVTIDRVLSPDFGFSPEKGPAPLEVTFDAGSSVYSEGEITAYDWDFRGGNTFSDASGKVVKNTFKQVGKYTVGLRISDGSTPPIFRTVTKDVTVEGSNMPTAVISIPTADGKYYSESQYTFEGEKSSSPNGKINKYEWDFGDQSPMANTRTATHTYNTPGDYEVTLKITDEAGITADAAQKIKVEKTASAPIAVISTTPAPASEKDDFVSGTLPFEVKFSASKSQAPDNNIVEYKWDFDGDGTSDSSGETSAYIYKTAGNFNATLTVIDANNNESKAVLVIKAISQKLKADLTANPVEGVAPLTVTLDASGSSYPAGKIVSFEWDFGDGSGNRIDVAKVTHKYTKIGTFMVKVTAMASDNSKSTVELPINVRPVPLAACFEAVPEQGAAPLNVEFDPRCSTGTVAKYSWDFGDNNTTRTRKPSHTYKVPGSYQVTLEVADSQNVINTFSKTILVTGNI